MQPAHSLAPQRISISNYLDGERIAEDRHEYIDGNVYAMAGESESHARASTNVVGMVHNHLRGKPCEVRAKDTKVRSGPGILDSRSTKGMFSYPDVVVLCGKPEYYDEKKDIVLNPSAIIEILSPTTEKHDRGDKFERYRRWNPTLREYVLVAQDRPFIEIFRLNKAGKWELEEIQGLDAVLRLETIQFEMRLSELYDRIEFPPPESDDLNPPSDP